MAEQRGQVDSLTTYCVLVGVRNYTVLRLFLTPEATVSSVVARQNPKQEHTTHPPEDLIVLSTMAKTTQDPHHMATINPASKNPKTTITLVLLEATRRNPETAVVVLLLEHIFTISEPVKKPSLGKPTTVVPI